MTTRNVKLTEQLDAFVENQVASGLYEDASEVIRASLRLLQHAEREDAEKLKLLRAAVKVGLDEIERGQHVDVTLPELRGYLSRLGARERAPGRDPHR